MSVQHGAEHRREGVARDDAGLDGQFLDVRFVLLTERNVTTKCGNGQIQNQSQSLCFCRDFMLGFYVTAAESSEGTDLWFLTFLL